MDEEVVTELIQNDFNAKNVKTELSKILTIEHRKELHKKYHLLEQKLGGAGASDKIAQLIVENI